MDDGGNTRDDLKNPDGDLGEEIKGAIGDGKDILVRIYVLSCVGTPNMCSYSFQCTVLSACGEESVIATKINTAVDK